MAFLPGLKKQFNKANQYMSERITGVEGTKLDREFEDMEKRTDLFNELVDDLQLKTKEYLQPNPTVRAKMAAVKGISKLSGQAKVRRQTKTTYSHMPKCRRRSLINYFIRNSVSRNFFHTESLIKHTSLCYGRLIQKTLLF